jgi:hypothetical protein
VAAPPPADVSAVPEPAGLVVSGRVSKLSASFAMVHAWTQLPMPKSEQVTELLTSEAVGPIVDLDQPVDFAVSVSGSGAKMKNAAAIAAAVLEPEKAKAALAERYKLVPGDGGVLFIQGLGKPAAKDDDDDDGPGGKHGSERTCELGPWLTRTATRAKSDADLHVDVRMQPLQSTIAEQKRLIGMILGGILGGRLGLTSLRDLAVAFGTDMVDFASDLDGASADVALTDAGASVSLALRLSGSSSTLGRTLVAHPERSGPAPAAFWQLPADADFAAFGRGIDEPQIARARELLLRALGDLLGEQGVKEPDRKAVVDALSKLVSPAATVYGSGIDRERVKAAHAREVGLNADDELTLREEAKIGTIEALLGWRLMEVDEPSSRFAAGLKELAAAVGRPSIASAYKAALKDAQPPTLRPAPVGKVGLPAGAQHYVLELHSLERKAMPPPRFEHGHGHRPAGPVKPIALHIFLVPDGQRTWLGIGGEEAVVAGRLATAMGQGGDKLAARGDLAALKGGAVGSGGFLSAQGVTEAAQLGPLLMHGSTWNGIETFEQAGELPHQGTTPVVFASTPQPGGPPAVSVSKVTVPRAAIEDAMAIALKHGGF